MGAVTLMPPLRDILTPCTLASLSAGTPVNMKMYLAWMLLREFLSVPHLLVDISPSLIQMILKENGFQSLYIW